MQPHILFNIGRLTAYLFLGLILGSLGSRLQMSLTFGAILIILVSIFMILNGLKMLGIKKLNWIQISLPKSLSKNISNEKNFQGKYMPTILGALTFLLPCGFTITVESLALLSGNPLNGALMMFLFAFGTIPGLLLVGFGSVSMKSAKSSANFSKVAGILVLLFAIFNINSQLNVLGLVNAQNLSVPKIIGNNNSINTAKPNVNSPPIVNGKQIIEMEADFRGYHPNHFVVKVGIPVIWKINDTGTNGCTGALIAKNFFNDIIQLTPGKTSEKEFIPKTVGNFRFSCTMGMVNGSIEVVN
jgi:sulfite exporter TauE/SafE